MTDKPTTKKNSILAFKKGGEPLLPKSDPKMPEALPRKAKAAVGRPTKGKAKRSHKVMLAMTEAEGEISRAKAGDLPEAMHVYRFLKQNGYFE